jgi:hypothetical protein
VWFLGKNRILYKSDGSNRIADNALVALTLMIAESKPDEKEMMVKVVVNRRVIFPELNTLYIKGNYEPF